MDTIDESVGVTVDHDSDFDAAFADASGSTPTPNVEAAQPAEDKGVDDGGADDVDKAAGDEGEGEGSDTGGEEGGSGDAGDAGDSDPSTDPADAPAGKPADKPTGTTEQPTQPQLDPKYLAQAIAEAQAQREAEQNKDAAKPEPEKLLTRDDFLDEAAAATVKKFETEWPEEYQAVQQLVQAELRAAIGNSFSNYTKQLNGVLAPLLGSVQKAEVNTYRGAVTAAHPDAFDIAPKVAEWIETQPSFVRAAYKHAYEKGTAQEAIELLNLYKTATGSTGAAPATPASSAAQEPPKPKPEVNRKAAKALAAVPAAQRPKPTGGADILDFDSAFAEATEVMANS